MGLLDGRVAIVTGASKGIGRALSLRFAREGAAVVCAARSADLVEATAAQVRAAGGKAIAVVCDAGLEDDVRRRAPVEPSRDRGPRWSRAGAASGRSVVVSRPPWSHRPARPAVPCTSDARAHRLGAASARGDGGDRHRERRARL
jgi:hypothetical protein